VELREKEFSGAVRTTLRRDRALSEGALVDALPGAAWIMAAVALLWPFPFKLMRRRVID